MKKILVAIAMSAFLTMSNAVWSHHAAEGIVSADIWLMVDGLLEDADSPHLDMDFTTMDTTSLVTSVTIPTEDVDDFVDAVYEGLDEMAGGAENVDVFTTDFDDGTTEVAIYEPIGSGQSQDVPEVPANDNPM